LGWIVNCNPFTNFKLATLRVTLLMYGVGPGVMLETEKDAACADISVD